MKMIATVGYIVIVYYILGHNIHGFQKSCLNTFTSSKFYRYHDAKKVRTNIPLSMQFSLQFYIENHLLLHSSKLEYKYIKTNEIVLKDYLKHLQTETVSIMKSKIESKAYVFLVDITVRSMEDLDEMYGTYSFWSRLKNKLSYSNSDISIDKFLYDVDIGDDRVCKIILARIPELMYQKLELARKVAGIVESNEVFVHITESTKYGSSQNDNSEGSNDMKRAITSAIQMKQFITPTLKQTKTLFSSEKNANEGYKPIDITFVTVITFSENGGYSPEVTITSDMSSPSSLLPDTADDQTKSKVSTIEIAMLEAAKKRNSGELNKSLDTFDISVQRNLNPSEDYFDQQSIAPSMAKGISSDFEEEVRLSNKIGSSTILQSIDTGEEQYKSLENTFQSKEYVRTDIFRIKAWNHGTNIARALISLPPNILHPQSYSSVIKRFAEFYKWDYSEWSAEDLKQAGCGAFYAVCASNMKNVANSTQTSSSSSSSSSSDRLIRLVYKGSKPSPTSYGQSLSSTPESISTYTITNERPIVLVGKGVCYDTGGINLKSANSMKTMKQDMAGSAVALGVLTALTLTDSMETVECWLAIVENNMMISSTSSLTSMSTNSMNPSYTYRPDDVVQAITGDTIEIVNSDSEGRMLLADVLAIASRKVSKLPFHSFRDTTSPKLLIDFATLTGTCVTSLTNRYIGAFTNRRTLINKILSVGEKCGERIWPMPLDEDFSEDLNSDIADILQCRQPLEGDHIYATSFLSRFINPMVPWVHLDLASSYRSGGLGHVDSDYTGSGVLAACQLIEETL